MAAIEGLDLHRDWKLILVGCHSPLHTKLGPCNEALQESTYRFLHVFVEVIFHMKNTLAQILSHYDSSRFQSLQVFQQHLLGGAGDHTGQLSQSYGAFAHGA